MDELDKGKQNTQVRRDTQVRGSLGVPPSGRANRQTEDQNDAAPELEPKRDQTDEEDDRMSER